MLRHRQRIGLKEVKPRDGKEHKNNSTHQSDDYGAIAFMWMIIIHIKPSSIRRQNGQVYRVSATPYDPVRRVDHNLCNA